MGYESASLFEIILNHHENYDGSGYPDGKPIDQVSIGARIVAVSEAYDSLTSWRPYRASWNRHAALEELKRDTTNGKFDPVVMRQLSSLFDDPAVEHRPLLSNSIGSSPLPPG